MRDSLKQLISSAIVFEYSLPHGLTPKVTVANVPDHCYRNQTSSVLLSVYVIFTYLLK